MIKRNTGQRLHAFWVSERNRNRVSVSSKSSFHANNASDCRCSCRSELCMVPSFYCASGSCQKADICFQHVHQWKVRNRRHDTPHWSPGPVRNPVFILLFLPLQKKKACRDKGFWHTSMGERCRTMAKTWGQGLKNREQWGQEENNWGQESLCAGFQVGMQEGSMYIFATAPPALFRQWPWLVQTKRQSKAAVGAERTSPLAQVICWGFRIRFAFVRFQSLQLRALCSKSSLPESAGESVWFFFLSPLLKSCSLEQIAKSQVDINEWRIRRATKEPPPMCPFPFRFRFVQKGCPVNHVQLNLGDNLNFEPSSVLIPQAKRIVEEQTWTLHREYCHSRQNNIVSIQAVGFVFSAGNWEQRREDRSSVRQSCWGLIAYDEGIEINHNTVAWPKIAVLYDADFSFGTSVIFLAP